MEFIASYIGFLFVGLAALSLGAFVPNYLNTKKEKGMVIFVVLVLFVLCISCVKVKLPFSESYYIGSGEPVPVWLVPVYIFMPMFSVSIVACICITGDAAGG